jgi:uncharacterized protein (DUF2141 family)
MIMRKLFKAAALCAALSAVLTFGSVAQAGTLELNIENVNEAIGTVFIGVYRVDANDSAAKEGTAWMKKSVGGRKVAVDASGTLTTMFKDLPDGEYALSLYWDKNNNGKMDSNMLGIPTEPYAFSNNARGSFGPPTWEKAMFKIEGAAKTSVKFD